VSPGFDPDRTMSYLSHHISDGLGVGIMAEIARVLVERDEPITGSAVFLFNGAEGEYFPDQRH